MKVAKAIGYFALGIVAIPAGLVFFPFFMFWALGKQVAHECREWRR